MAKVRQPKDTVYTVRIYNENDELVDERVYKDLSMKAVKALLKRAMHFREDDTGMLVRQVHGFNVTQQGCGGARPHHKQVPTRPVNTVVWTGGTNVTVMERAEIWEFTDPRQVA